MKRLLLLFFALSLLVLIGFALWGEAFETAFSGGRSREWFQAHRALAGLAGAGLLVADLLLPIPTTVVIGAMGAALGPLYAALWGWAGLTGAGMLGYGLARWGGRRWGERLVTREERERFEPWFARWGSLAVVISRFLPVLPEVLSVLAGLYGMRLRHFTLAVGLGSIPPALVFALVGAEAMDHPGRGLTLLVMLTVLLWLILRRISPPRPGESVEKD